MQFVKKSIDEMGVHAGCRHIQALLGTPNCQPRKGVCAHCTSADVHDAAAVLRPGAVVIDKTTLDGAVDPGA